MAYRITARQRELAEAIQSYCRNGCPATKTSVCGFRTCQLYPYRVPITTEPDQGHLFMESDFPKFRDGVMTAALWIADAPAMGGAVWWHEVRLECDRRKVFPVQSSWWGKICHTKQWRSSFVITSDTMRNPYPGTNGTAEFRWRRRGTERVQVAVSALERNPAPNAPLPAAVYEVTKAGGTNARSMKPDPAWRDD